MKPTAGVCAAAALLVLATPPAKADDACPTPPQTALQAIPAEARVLDPYSINQTVANYYAAPLGQGFLKVTAKQGDEHYYDWMFHVELPLWTAPDTHLALGWLRQGVVNSGSHAETVTGAGMVETRYEHVSFIVWDTQNSWLKLKITEDLYAWTHQCHFDTSRFDIEFVSWASFLREHSDWVHFRRPVSHVLRAAPNQHSPRVTTVGQNHKLVVLDIQGDWMQVDTEQPDTTCSGPDQSQQPVTKHRGWVMWRDSQGPWVYVYTRGC